MILCVQISRNIGIEEIIHLSLTIVGKFNCIANSIPLFSKFNKMPNTINFRVNIKSNEEYVVYSSL